MLFGPRENLSNTAPDEAGSCFFPTYLDLANILGSTDFHSEKNSVFKFVCIPDFQIQEPA